MIDSLHAWPVAEGLALVVAAVCSAALIAGLRPLLMRYVLARPNARSSHREPTPQGGGIGVIAATIAVGAAATYLFPGFLHAPSQLAAILAATVGMAIVGVTADLELLGPARRLPLQAVIVIALIALLPSELRIVPALPLWIERAVEAVALVWFVNLVNFMDGIDWMTVAEVVPLTAGLALFGLMSALPREATVTALALCGATIGFAPFNRPVARLFLGDVGSLPMGLVLGWLLIALAGNGYLAAALLLPLYYLADATITLLRRLINGEPVTRAHRSHFYQRATDGGFSVTAIVGRVLLVNIGLIALAVTTLLTPSFLAHGAALVAGCALVGLLLYRFAAGKG
jgi:UDP-N-acetylmuramyl pentapeptide phosphotransferase/UDP-N-acetylglucosamine-1-phosphate transferase